MRTETLVESRTQEVSMSHEEAKALQAAGKRLASDTPWWGTEELSVDRTVLQCTQCGPGRWKVRVSDAVGIIAVPGVQFLVEPKIPINHLLYLFVESGRFPQLDDPSVEASTSSSLWELVAEWFVKTMERVLRQDLIRDYHEQSDIVPFIRGRLDVADAVQAYYKGKTHYLCNFEEFGLDTPLNRVLKMATRVVLSSEMLNRNLRRRASRIAARFEDVGECSVSDQLMQFERRTQHYRDAHLLALHVIRSSGRYLGHGTSASWAFLIRTPLMVEDGIRRILSAHCHGWSLGKQRRRLGASSMTLNPDMVVEDGLAIADVKYKLSGKEWNRADLYEVVTFATGYRTPFAAIIDFREPETPPVATVPVGDISVAKVSWPADASLKPDEAASCVVDEFSTWLRGLRAA